ncbi:protein kinase [Kitasatospora sp. GAS204B]|uniref:protein kinase domain-containing protein n=1 Tax=unclassified Kitasatospora TaxID=2633591 RepID=UPI002474C8F6|nr:protein kinase [Kitasatospora sp. GAS204B]
MTDRQPSEADAAGPRRLAVDLHGDTPVLLEGLELPELLVPELTGSADFEGSRWLDPAEILAAVRAVLADTPEHPRLRQSFEVFAADGVVWAAVERPPARALPELLAAGPLDPYRAAELAADLCGALAALHLDGHPHGNLAVEQVLVCEDGAALLGGQAIGAAQEALARALGGADGRRWAQARTGLVGARAERWPPELLAAEAAGPAADLWALGVLLHRVLTGYGPFPEQSPTALFAAVRAAQRADSAGCGPLRPLVDRLLAGDPAERPSAVEARQCLTELLAQAPEPYRAEEVESALPVLRPAGPLVPRPRRWRPVAVVPEHARHARAQRPSRLLPALLVGGVMVAMVLAIAAVAVFAG